MKVTVCQLDNRDDQIDNAWVKLRDHLQQASSEFLLLPEMCFHEWLAADADADDARWQAAIDSHNQRIEALDEFAVPAIIGTRPINTRSGHRNQAYLWTEDAVQAVHEKYYLPDESGYWEAHWYDRGELKFDFCEALGLKIGIQICTEMWFFEWARHFARAGVEMLCIPRATPHASTDKWLAGGRTAAVCAGAYCLSSNIWNPPGAKADCGGAGWIISPEGEVLATTDEDTPFVSMDIDIEFARQSKTSYPRYVAE